MPRRHKSKITEDPIIDTSISYINKLKQLKNAKTIEESNKIMTTFGDVPKSSKVYFRHLVICQLWALLPNVGISIFIHFLKI